MIADWIDHELHNWGRWCNSGQLPQARRRIEDMQEAKRLREATEWL